MTIHMTHGKAKTITRRGQQHEDAERLVVVLRVKKDMLGIILKNKKTNEETKLGISTAGAKALAGCLGKVLRGRLKIWKEPLKMEWTAQFVITTQSESTAHATPLQGDR